MQNNLTYRKCTIVDLELLTKISRDTFVDAFEKDNNPDDFKTYINSAFSNSQIETELLNPDSQFYFCYLDDELFCYFKINEKEAQAEAYGNASMELSRIYILKPFQGQQLGTRILQKIIDIAKSKQKTWLWLGVWQLNFGAVRFYERHGFKKFDTHSFYIGDDRQMDWLMRLDLD